MQNPKETLEQTLEKYFTDDEPILVGCSTWPDSMYLVYQILQTKFAKNLVVGYFNHKLRMEADDEEIFIENLGKKLGFPVEIGSADIKKIRDSLYPSMGIEEVARNKRYAFFNALCNIYNTNKVVLAHHMDDKIETFFFNLARGSKLTGLINMTEFSGGIIRPLLNMQKSEILHYLDTNNLEYRIDQSNFDTSLSRNFLRHEIIPKFENINSKYKENIGNMMEYLEELKKHIDSEIKDFLYEQGMQIFNSAKYRINTLEIYGYFYIDAFQKLSPFLQKELIRHCFYVSNDKSTLWLTSANIDEIIRFIGGKNNKTIKEIKNLKMRKENEIIVF